MLDWQSLYIDGKNINLSQLAPLNLLIEILYVL